MNSSIITVEESERIAIAYAEWTVLNSAFALYGFDGAYKIFIEEYNAKRK